MAVTLTLAGLPRHRSRVQRVRELLAVTDADRIQMIRWALHHAGEWLAVAERDAARAELQAAE